MNTYQYRKADRTVIYDVVRTEPKGFFPRHPDANGEMRAGLNGTIDRVPYRLPELLAEPTRAVIWVEGEKDVDRLMAEGLLATTTHGGAKSYRKHAEGYSAYFKGRPVVAVIPDNDPDGQAYAAEVAASLHRVGAGARVVELPGLPPKGDVSDWLDQGHTVDELRSLVKGTRPWVPPAVEAVAPAAVGAPPSDQGQATDEAWPQLTAIDEHGILPTFPGSTLPAWMGQFVQAVSRATQTPPCLPALLTLAAVAALVGGRVRVRVRDGWQEPVNIFVAVALPPGERKSAVFSTVTAPLIEFERQRIEEMEPAHREATTRKKIADGALDKARADAVKDPGAVAAAVRAAEELDAILVPPRYRLLADDATQEAVASLLAEQSGRLAIMSPEGGIFDLMAGRYSTSGATNLDVYLKGHAGDSMRIDRKGRPPEHIRAPALTLGLAIQPDVLRSLADRPGFRGRGLLARFLYAIPVSRVGGREIGAQPVSASVDLAYQANLASLARTLTSIEEAAVLVLSPEALAAFTRFERRLEPRLGRSGDLSHIGDWGSKLAGATARIAALLHVAERVGGLSVPISGSTMAGAIEIADYLIPHAVAAFAAMGADPELDNARRVLHWISDRGLQEFSVKVCFEALRGRFHQVRLLQPALSLLEQHGYIRRRESSRPPRKPGRSPSPIYDVHPLLAQSAQSAQYAGPGSSADIADIAGQAGDSPVAEIVVSQEAPRERLVVEL